MLTGKTGFVRLIINQTRKHRTLSIKGFKKPENFISFITVGLTCVVFVNENFDVMKYKETSKLKTIYFLQKYFKWSKIY